MQAFHGLSLRTKILLVLLGVLLPVFFGVTYLENKMTQPALSGEIRRAGVALVETLAAEMEENHYLDSPLGGARLRARIKDLIYLESNVLRIDVLGYPPDSHELTTLLTSASSIPQDRSARAQLVDHLITERISLESGAPAWEIVMPVYSAPRGHSDRALVRNVRALLSLKLVETLLAKLWRNAALAGLATVGILITIFNFFLKKTIDNEKLLRASEVQNLQLVRQMREMEAKIHVNDKLAAMGHLTATLAHEIGSPLTAVSAHLQLLRREIQKVMPPKDRWVGRLDTVNAEILKIEKIITGFLQTTTTPEAELELVDVNQIVERTIAIVQPRLEEARILWITDLQHDLGRIRVAPLELEQVVLNLLNNAIDSITAKKKPLIATPVLEITTKIEAMGSEPWAVVSIYDTGTGIATAHLGQVFKPFFTTKPAGKGTGLGLVICKQLVEKYGGSVALDSHEGEWTRATIKIPQKRAV